MTEDEKQSELMLTHDGTPDKDELGRGLFIKQIETLVTKYSSHESLVIGIYGSWGEGKSYVMETLKKELQEQRGAAKDIIVVSFNPWLLGNPELLLTEFFNEVQTAMEAELLQVDLRPYVKKFFSGFTSVVGGAIKSVYPGTEHAVDPVAKFVDGLMAQDSLQTIRDAINEKLNNSGKKIIIFIDDLDRLDDTEIHLMVQLVKRVAGFKNFMYILAFDDEIVASALGKRYSLGDDVGANFLDKIVQAPFRLPKISRKKLEEMTYRSICSIINNVNDTFDSGELVKQVQWICGHSIGNCRDLKRFCNALSLSLLIRPQKTYISDFIALESLRIFYPKIYKTIFLQREIFLNGSINLGHILRLVSEDLRAPLDSQMKYLFPRITQSPPPENLLRVGRSESIESYFTYLE